MIAPTTAQIKHVIIEVILAMNNGLIKCSKISTTIIIETNGNIAFFIIFSNSLYSKFISFFNFLNDIVNDKLVPIIVEIIAP